MQNGPDTSDHVLLVFCKPVYHPDNLTAWYYLSWKYTEDKVLVFVIAVSGGLKVGPLLTETPSPKSDHKMLYRHSKAESRTYSSRCFEIWKLDFCLPKLRVQKSNHETLYRL